ncbi:MAG TPA: metal-sulfur cluster assembly factor [Chthonomonadales bacterium]|nr:metal-sulfur cluster assembly factor [Chthonomonadales bacterium]
MAEAEPGERVATIDEIRAKLAEIEDPELRFSIVDLGLVYDIRFENGVVEVDMTLTTPACPIGPMIQELAEHSLKQLPGVEEVVVNLVWDPPWDPRTMASDEIKMLLGIW